ncbi:MAG: GtrA family protein [Treponema sp.]|nr:GtrA family protein [Treponema sp.]
MSVKLSQFAKCFISSLFSAFLDFLIFYLVNKCLSITASTVIARIASTTVNFLINKFWAFESDRNFFRESIPFAVLFVCKMAASAALVNFFHSILSETPVPTIVIKICVDGTLFFVSYVIQKKFIFAKS